ARRSSGRPSSRTPHWRSEPQRPGFRSITSAPPSTRDPGLAGPSAGASGSTPRSRSRRFMTGRCGALPRDPPSSTGATRGWKREEAIATGIFGPQVSDQARERIGDVVAAAYGRVGIVQRDVDPAQARLNGHHGSLTPAEQLVPLLMYRS